MSKDRKSTRLNSSHITRSRMPSSACPTVICLPNTCSFYWRVTTSEARNPGPYSSINYAIEVFSAPLPPLLVLLLLLCCYYCSHTTVVFHITSVTSAFPGVAELTTQLLRLISILWLPLCPINKFGFYFPRRYSAIP